MNAIRHVRTFPSGRFIRAHRNLKGNTKMLSRETEWVWDSWYVVDGQDLHAFYLMAPKVLGDPDLRHVNARVGHSVSRNGIDWEHLPEALGPSTGNEFDNQATWTGSIVKVEDTWHMFFTGINSETRERRQAVGHAISSDLISWTRLSTAPIVSAHAPYSMLDNPRDGAEHFRDPWVFSQDGLWHMLVTASDEEGWGTIAHATSVDLDTWELQDPLVTDSHLKQIEVTETLCIDGQWVLLFCAGPTDIQREVSPTGFGTYCVPAEGPLGPFDLDRTELLADEIYAARAVFFNQKWILLGFSDTGKPGGFTGVICDPIELTLSNRGTLEFAELARR